MNAMLCAGSSVRPPRWFGGIATSADDVPVRDERYIEELKRWCWWILGAAAGSGAVLSAIVGMVEVVVKR